MNPVLYSQLYDWTGVVALFGVALMMLGAGLMMVGMGLDIVLTSIKEYKEKKVI